jgi:hypothetical protein
MPEMGQETPQAGSCTKGHGDIGRAPHHTRDTDIAVEQLATVRASAQMRVEGGALAGGQDALDVIAHELRESLARQIAHRGPLDAEDPAP